MISFWHLLFENNGKLWYSSLLFQRIVCMSEYKKKIFHLVWILKSFASLWWQKKNRQKIIKYDNHYLNFCSPFPCCLKEYPTSTGFRHPGSPLMLLHISNSRTRYIARYIDPEYSLSTRYSFTSETPCINTHPLCSSYLLNILFCLQLLLLEKRKVSSLTRPLFDQLLSKGLIWITLPTKLSIPSPFCYIDTIFIMLVIFAIIYQESHARRR